MDRIRSLFSPKPVSHEYTPLNDPPAPEELPHALENSGFLDDSGDGLNGGDGEVPFSWVEYALFASVGVAMLWAWNMFMAAAPYFSLRLSSSPSLQSSSQSSIISVSTVTNLVALLVLSNIQYTASYPFRINVALVMNIACFSLLTLSTFVWVDCPAGLYFTFLLAMVATSAWAAGLMQNGAFSFAASFGRPEYTQAIMAGQGLAGVLPPITQMASVLLVPDSTNNNGSGGATTATRFVSVVAKTMTSRAADTGARPPAPPPPPGLDEAGASAFLYFLTAMLISLLALLAFQPIVRRNNLVLESRVEAHMAASFHSVEEAERAARRPVSLVTLLSQLRWLAAAVFMCFAVTMLFPVFTSKIVSVTTPSRRDDEQQGRDGKGKRGALQDPGLFIPLGFFFWNLGDLCGRVSTSLPSLLPGGKSLRRRPPVLLLIALLRIGFLPLYMLCNVDNRGALVGSDLFYLLLVQLPFGLSNGWLGTSCMVGASEWVDEGQREAAGGFMSLVLVAGLTTGSLGSFGVSAL